MSEHGMISIKLPSHFQHILDKIFSRQCTRVMFRAAIVCYSTRVDIHWFVCICAHLWLPVGICSSAITGCFDTIFFITWMSQCCINHSQKAYSFFERYLYLYYFFLWFSFNFMGFPHIFFYSWEVSFHQRYIFFYAFNLWCIQNND